MEGYIGEVRAFASTWAPRNWVFCQGQLLSISQNEALYSIVGTTYGGDGRTTFALPDLRGRTIIGAGQGNGLTNRKLGASIGNEEEYLTMTEMPAHDHIAIVSSASGAGTVSGDVKIPVNTTGGDDDIATNNFISADANGEKRFANSPSSGTYLGALASDLAVDLSSIDVTVNVINTGNGLPFDKMKPATVSNYIICIVGIYPSRS